jgi:hypothetical protein
MPTDKQLIDSWRAQSVLGISDYYCSDYSHEPTNEKDYSQLEDVVDNTKTGKLELKIKKD